MESLTLDNLVQLVEPHQKAFVPSQSSFSAGGKGLDAVCKRLATKVEPTQETIIDSLLKQYQINDPLTLFPADRDYTLYASLLNLLDPDYKLSLYSDKSATVSQFIDFIISRISTDVRIKKHLADLRLTGEALIPEIRDRNYQSPNVIYYLCIVLDLNIIVFTSSGCPDLYYADDQYDNCKPHVLLYRDNNQKYASVIYGSPSGSQLLTYHGHALIRRIADTYQKKVICRKNYLGPSKKK